MRNEELVFIGMVTCYVAYRQMCVCFELKCVTMSYPTRQLLRKLYFFLCGHFNPNKLDLIMLCTVPGCYLPARLSETQCCSYIQENWGQLICCVTVCITQQIEAEGYPAANYSCIYGILYMHTCRKSEDWFKSSMRKTIRRWVDPCTCTEMHIHVCMFLTRFTI